MGSIHDFYSMRNRRVVGWEDGDYDRDSISPSSSFATDQSRIKTEKQYVDNPEYIAVRKKAERLGKPINWDYGKKPTGKMVDQKVDMVKNIQRGIGLPIHGTAFKNPSKRKSDDDGTCPSPIRGW